MSRLNDIMAQAQRILNSLNYGGDADLHDKGTDRLLADLEQPSIVAESERLTGELFPDRAARLAAEQNAAACEDDDAEDPEPFDEFTGPMADESGASAGMGGGR